MALTAWLIAPAPIAWTSTRPLLRITPAIAPATATGFEVAETLSTSTGTRSADIAGTPSNVFTVDSLDRCSPAAGSVKATQYRIESHGSGRHHKAVRDARQEALDDDLPVHPDTAVPRPDHAHVGDVGGAPGQDAGVRGGDVGVGAHHRAGPALQVPAHGRLLRGRLGVHVAEHNLHVRVLGQDRVRGPEGVVEGVEEDAADQVHDQHLVPAGLDHAPALARRRRRVVGRPEHVLQAWQLADELLLGEDVVAAGDHVRAQAFELRRDLRGQAEPARGVLAVEDGEVRPQLLFQLGKDRLDRFAAGVADHVGDEEDLELVVRHPLILVEKEKREPLRTPSGDYFAYSTALVSRTTVTRIWPGKLSSDSMRLAMSRAISWAAASSICSGLTRIRTSRPAWMAWDCWTPVNELPIS